MKSVMARQVSIDEKVRQYYWQDDLNCATTTLRILSEIFSVTLSDQVLSAAIGMHGAGRYGAQCGLVEGTLMVLGSVGREHRLPEESIVDQCREFARQFESTFHSLSCSRLRPEGFRKDNPPHICEKLTCTAIEFSRDFVSQWMEREMARPDNLTASPAGNNAY